MRSRRSTGSFASADRSDASPCGRSRTTKVSSSAGVFVFRASSRVFFIELLLRAYCLGRGDGAPARSARSPTLLLAEQPPERVLRRLPQRVLDELLVDRDAR